MSSSCVFSSWCSSKQCGSERMQPLKKKAGGGLGGRAHRLPPDAFGAFAFVGFSVYIFFSSSCVFSSWCSSKQCGSERMQP